MKDCHQTLLDEISKGNENAFAQIYHHFYRRLLAFANTILHSAILSEEVIEDVFIKLWRRRQNLSGINNLSVYLYVAAKNTALNAIAGKAKELVTKPFDSIDFDFNHDSLDPYQLLITQEMMQRMRKAIDQLPPRCKMIFKLVREDGLKYKEVAVILNISVNTIDAQMAIAVKRISSAFQLSHSNAISTFKK